MRAYAAEFARMGGKKGGPARAAKLTDKRKQDIAREAATVRMKNLLPDERSKIAQKASRARWDKVRASKVPTGH